MAAAGGIKAGKAFVLIEALDKTKIGLQGVHNSLRKFGSDIATAGQNILMKSIGALIPIGLSEKIYAEFDDSMRKVEARSEGTAAQLGVLREEAKRLGRDTAFTSRHIGELQAKIAQKGFNRSDIFKMTEPITNLARAAGEGADLMLDATTAAALVTGTLRSYSMSADDATHVADLFTVAVNNSNYSLEELGSSLQYVGPEAAEFGLSLEETLALLGGMRDLGIDSSIAGTSLRNMFTFLAKTTHQEKFNEKLKELTGNTIEFTDAAGNLHPLPDLLLALGKATASLGTGTRSDIYSEMFGTRVTVSAKAAVKHIENYNKTLFKLQAQSEGVAKKTHDTMEAGIGGIFRELLSAVEAVGLSIGEVLSPALAIGATIIDKMAKLTSAWVLENRAIVLTVIGIVVAIGLLGLGLTALGITISIIGSLLGTVITVLTVLTAVLTFVASPLGLLVIVIAAAVVLLGLLAYKFLDLSSIIMGVVNSSTTLTSVFNIINFGCQEAIEFLARLSKALGKAFAAGELKLASELMWAQITVAWVSATNFLLSLFDGLNSGIDFVIDSIEQGFLLMLKSLATQLGNFVDFYTSTLTTIQNDPRLKAIMIGLGIDDTGLHTAINATKIGLATAKEKFSPEVFGAAADEVERRKTEDAHALVRRQLERELLLAKSQAERDRLLALVEALEEKPVEDIDDILRTRMEGMDRRAGELIKAGGPGGIVAPKANIGLEKGSVEAAKQFQENLYNQTTALGVAKEHLEVGKEALDKLDEIDRTMKEAVFGEIG